MTKQLIIDIERLPGKFEGTFWGPNDMKNRRIPPDWVTRDPRTICFAWKWKGERKIDFVSEWDDGPEAMAKVALDLYIEADIVTGHNIKGFDTPHLAGLCKPYGLILPRVQHYDTLLVARREFNFEYNHLDVLCKRFGLKGKVDHYDPDVAELAVDGHEPSQRKLRRYNIGDIPASEKVADYLAPHSGINFSAFNDLDGLFCPTCGSAKLQQRGYRHTAVGLRYARYQCQNAVCGAWSQARLSDKDAPRNEVKPA